MHGNPRVDCDDDFGLGDSGDGGCEVPKNVIGQSDFIQHLVLRYVVTIMCSSLNYNLLIGIKKERKKE